MNPGCTPAQAARQQGMTLIELMVAMLLGLLLVAGALSLTLANRRSHDANEGLSQVQESARTAFEMLARDVRQSGPAGCGNPARITNDLVAGTLWWQNWFGIRGYDDTTAGASPFGTAAGQRISGTDAMQTQGLQGQGYSVESHDQTAATITVNSATDIIIGDPMVICDADHTTIFQAATYDSATNTLGSATGGSPVPGNCSTGLGYPTVCTSPGTVYKFARNSLLAHLAATEWYVGANGRTNDSGRSLYRRRLGTGGATPPILVEEVVADVTDMQITYRVGTAATFVDASTLTTADWANVNAVSIAITVDSADTRVTTTPSTNSGRIRRTFTQVVALRNRMP